MAASVRVCHHTHQRRRISLSQLCLSDRLLPAPPAMAFVVHLLARAGAVERQAAPRTAHGAAARQLLAAATADG
jgi:hypothetical protein